MKTIQNIWILVLLLVSIACEKEVLEETTLVSTNFKSNIKTSKNLLKENLIIDEAPFEKREGHTSVVFDGKMWVLGGYEGFSGFARNDIWFSKDGVSWKNSFAVKHFSPRTSHTTTVFKDKVWVIGGNEIPNRTNDVWQSSDGIFWEEVTSKAGFSERSSHTALAFNNKLWVIGGLDQEKKPKNDVWYSKNGIDWIQATPKAAFSPRFSHTSFIYDGKMWVIGGRNGFGTSNKVGVKNDVWYSKNGVDWVQSTPNSEFSPRSNHASVVYDNKMWVLGGSDKASNKIADAWCSENGKIWKLALKHEFLQRTAHSTTVFDKKIWVIAGIGNQTLNDVWTLQK